MRTRGYHFRLILTVVILSLLALSLGLVGAISIYFGRVAVRELAGSIVQQTALRVDGRLRELGSQARDQNALNVKLMGANAPASGDFLRLAASLVPAFELHKELRRVYFGLEQTGEFFSVDRDEQGAIGLVERLVEPGKERALRRSRWTGNDWALEEHQPFDGYDPRERTFFQQAKSVGTNTWTESYTFWSRQGGKPTTGITFATPVYDARHRLAGVWGVDLDTLSVCAFLDALKAEVPGYAFIVEEEADGRRRVIAHPDAALLIDPKTGLLHDNADQVQDDVMRAFLRKLPAGFKNLPTGQSAGFDFTVGGKEYLGGCYLSDPDARWLVGMVLPKDKVMGRVRQTRFWYGVTFLGVLALAVGLIIGVSHRTSAPLRELHREADAIGRLELASTPPVRSRIHEIRDLGDAFSRMKANLRSFQKYVPADLVSDLLRSGQEATVGGRHIEATIYFSDIADFTATAESLDPAALVAHLGDYLNAMAGGIAAHQGTVDKFIGDAVMAFWNAPRPNPAHALQACRAALANQRTLIRLQSGWVAAGKPAFHTRIGLHTGPVVVGNIGSEQRMNYTVIGDTVNLASRLESLNKFYGTRIIISQATLDAAGNAVLARPLDWVNVKGKSNGLVIHELIALRADATPDQAASAQRAAEAFTLYREKNFSAAAECYARLVASAPGDHAAEVLHRRCHAFAAQLPPPDWDGVHRLEVK